MIPQGYPLYVVDEDGGLHVVIGWMPKPPRSAADVIDRAVSPFEPLLVDISGYLDPIGAMRWNRPLRYFASIDDALPHTNGDFKRGDFGVTKVPSER